MATFTDNSGRTWTVQVNVETIRRVRAMVEVDLLDTAGGEVLERLITDPVLLCDVLYALCKEQANGQGVATRHDAQEVSNGASARKQGRRGRQANCVNSTLAGVQCLPQAPHPLARLQRASCGDWRTKR